MAYHLRLTRQGNVKIFENVINHKIDFNKDEIIINQEKNDSLLSRVTSLIYSEYYSIEKFPTPEYELDGDWHGTKVELYA